MPHSAYIVVGEDYGLFAKTTNSLTFKELEEQSARLGPDDILLVGQGLSTDQRNRLAQLPICQDARLILHGDEPCPLELNHKRSLDNVIISHPRRSAAGQWEFQLRLNAAHDRLADHVTGQHVNGMLLIEASRQAVIATVELGYIAKTGRQWGFAWTRCDTRFSAYAYPVPTKIAVTTSPLLEAQGNQIPVQLVVTFLQGDVMVCESHYEITLLDPKLVDKVESRGARQAAARALAAGQAQLSALEKQSA